MTEAQVRQKVLGFMQGWVGLKRSNRSHAPIIDTYNARTPRPRGYKVTYTDAYCATTVSAAAIKAGFTDIMPIECSCYYLIEQAKKMGIWKENDAYVPKPADEILYDWDDGANYATTDNTGSPEHVGMVEAVSGNKITVIEGNINGGNVGRRTLEVNGRYIRGYITPNYKSKASEKDPAPASGSAAGSSLAVGTIVNFTGNKHYTSANATSGKSCKPGKAKITQVYNGKHKYHLVAVSGGGSTVHGWVDASDIEGAAAGSSGNSGSGEIKVGDIVKYSGTVHYTSSYAEGKSRACKGGKAKVTQISKGKPHPYHLESVEKGCTVHGWVNADKVSR